MNVLPCSLHRSTGFAETHSPRLSGQCQLERKLGVGIRPEFVRFADDGIPVNIEKVEDLGRYQVVSVTHDGKLIKMLVGEDQVIPSEAPAIEFDAQNTHLYQDDCVETLRKSTNNKAWWLVVPVLLLVAFNAFIPLMTVVNYSLRKPLATMCFSGKA